MHWVSHETCPRKRRDHNVRKDLALLLTAVLLVFTLTACGRNQQNNGTTNGTENGSENGTVTENNGGVLDNGTNGNTNGNTNGTINGQDNTNGGVMNDLENAGNDLAHGAEDLVDDVLPGENNTNASTANGNTANGNTANGNAASRAVR